MNQNRLGIIDGVSDHQQILSKFVDYFKETGCNLSANGNKVLYDTYVSKRSRYVGTCHRSDFDFDVALVESVIVSLKRGKAAGLDGLNAEHLQHSHPAICLLLAKLFKCMIRHGCVPDDFGLSYTVPLLKNSNSNFIKSLLVNDFRGISISQVISKLFECCILGRYQDFLVTSGNQFGFKAGVGCSHAIYVVKTVVNLYVDQGSTVNLCALDLTKAFDKVNHYGLFLKLMDRLIPDNLLSVLEFWYDNCATCVRWGDHYSVLFSVACGIRQGSVLSPHLFAVYVDDIVTRINESEYGCTLEGKRVGIIMYADDILLLAPSVESLQRLLCIVESELVDLDMSLNSKKSFCIRFGNRYQTVCSNLISLRGDEILWTASCRYLGVYLSAYRNFKCDFSSAKKAFYRSVNAIYGKVLRVASEEVVIQLISSKCLPVLLYGLDVCSLTTADYRSFDFVQTRVLMKLFKTSSNTVVKECCNAFGLQPISDLIRNRKCRFLTKLTNCIDNNSVVDVVVTAARRELSAFS